MINKLITIKDINLSVARKISEKKAKALGVIPYKEDDKRIYILIKEYKENILNDIGFIFRKKVVVKEVSNEDIEYFIEIIYLGLKDDAEKSIIEEAIVLKASDIHFEPNKECVYIRFRIDGLLRVMYILEKEEYLSVLSKIKIRADLDITERRKPKDGKLSMVFGNIDYDLRISIIPTVYGEKAVIRILYGELLSYSLDQLRLTETQLKKLKVMMKVNSGLIIINGPTGSGKSTTLYCILQELNDDETNISTLEDPIEAILPGVNQMSLNKTLNIGFAEGLRSFLRQDPDVIMLGEIRDEETAEMAVRAALTGHKVYSTIHTKNPREVYFRLEDMNVESYLIRDSLTGIISQRLIRLLCDSCKEFKEVIKINNNSIKSYIKCGCKYCNYTGYRGRALVASINIIDNKVKESLKDIYTKDDILSNDEMIQNLDMLFEAGNISYEDYINFIEKEGLEIVYEKKAQ